MATIKHLGLYCGSSEGANAAYRAAAARLGAMLAASGIELVYGGGRVGLMGIAADAALAAKGRVTGVVPEHLRDLEVGHAGLTQMIVVASMHERKQRMFELSDGFVVLPGGLGTLDETIEVITWKQLRLHEKPIVILDLEGYWAPLLALVDHVIAEGFAPAAARGLFRVVASVEELLPTLRQMPEPVAPAQSGRV